MSYSVLYRKYRPQLFAEVSGQDPVVVSLRNQIAADRIGHAYLFCGMRGTGKTSIAKIFAKAVNCMAPVGGEPCLECESCRSIQAGSAMNVYEIDAASNNGVANIRDIVEEVRYSPVSGKYKVYIIDEVHMMSDSAFNALLKTLEEPPSYAIFILATTEPQDLPMTILSRCQRYDFHRIGIGQISDRLRDIAARSDIQIDTEALGAVARYADGAMRDAISLLDRLAAFYAGKEIAYDDVTALLGTVDTDVFARLLEGMSGGDVDGCMRIISDAYYEGSDMSQLCVDFSWFLRNILLLRVSDQSKKHEELFDLSQDTLARLSATAKQYEAAAIMRYLSRFSMLIGELKNTSDKRLALELAVIRLCLPQTEMDTDALLDRIRVLEQKVGDIDRARTDLADVFNISVVD